MKNELRDSALWAVIVSFFSAILVLAGTVTTAILNRKSKDAETTVKAASDITDDRKDITDGYRQSWQDCKEENKELKAENLSLRRSTLQIESEKKPLRFRAEQEKRLREHYEETLLIHDLICLLPSRENISKLPGPAQP